MQMSTEDKPIVLSHEDLAAVVAKAPLVSLDLIIENSSGKILVGMRNNEPARGFFFIPGGRILKNERVADAFERIIKRELGIKADYRDAEFIGVFEHIYGTNFAQREGFGTHYVVLAHRFKVGDNIDITHDDQHSELLWLDKEELLNNEKVHPYTKAYFETNLKGLIAKE
jgi:colanic acid biosynthesis protein WcaH